MSLYVVISTGFHEENQFVVVVKTLLLAPRSSVFFLHFKDKGDEDPRHLKTVNGTNNVLHNYKLLATR